MIQAFLAKILGLFLVSMSIFVKIPQIKKLYLAKSGAGLVISSNLIDLFGLSLLVGYARAANFPFRFLKNWKLLLKIIYLFDHFICLISSYGDAVFAVLQTFIVNYLVIYYDCKLSSILAFVSIYVTLMTIILIPGLVPMSVHFGVQVIMMPLGFGGKGMQVKHIN